MSTLLIARPSDKGTDFSSLTRLLAELWGHGYRLAVVEIPTTPVLSRLADHGLFIACEPTNQGACLRPLVVRLREPASTPPLLHPDAEVELMTLPPQLARFSRWLCKQFHPGLFEQVPAPGPGPGRPITVLHRFLPAAPQVVNGRWFLSVDTTPGTHPVAARLSA